MSTLLLIHISDLHFDAEYYPPATSPTTSGLQKTVRSFARHVAQTAGSLVRPQGLVPHDPLACQQLEHALHRLRGEVKPERCLVLVTGDLTTSGAASEFVLALTYLRSRIRVTRALGVGLQFLADQVFAVPGNHDHWGGFTSSVMGRNGPVTALYDDYFGPPNTSTWYWHEILSCSGFQIELCGIDSCGNSVAQPLARGSIDPAALHELSQLMGRPSRPSHAQLPCARLLLLHHSPGYRASGVQGAVNQWAHELDGRSKKDLADFCQQQQIHFVLTGHTHTFMLPSSRLSHTFGTELNCGTTLQGAPNGKLPSRHGQTFLAHTLRASASGLQWTTRVFQRLLKGPFKEAKGRRYTITFS